MALNSAQSAINTALKEERYDPYKALGFAIASQAFYDLKHAYAVDYRNWSRDSQYGQGTLICASDLEQFFLGDEYEFLTGRSDGKTVINIAKARSRFEKFRYINKCKSCKDKECKYKDPENWRLGYKLDSYACPNKYVDWSQYIEKVPRRKEA